MKENSDIGLTVQPRSAPAVLGNGAPVFASGLSGAAAVLPDPPEKPSNGPFFSQVASRTPIRVTTSTVSVIVPNWNCGAYLPRCLESLKSQTHPVEIVLVDDGSTDGSREILDRYAARVKIVVHSERRGANAARNTGLRAASGDWIVFADADAVYRPDWIESLLAAVQNDARLGVVYSGFIRRFDDGREQRFSSRDWDPCALWWENYIGMPSLIRREALPDGGLDETSTVFDDWQLWLDLHNRGWTGRRVAAELFTAMVRHEGKTLTNSREPARQAAVIAGLRRRYARIVGAEQPIGVVIPAAGSEDLTIRCLEHLAKFCGIPFRVYYVDNGSPTRTIDSVREAADMNNIDFTIHENSTNEGFTPAVNRGLRAAGYRHALVLNNDCFVAPNCVERLWWTLTRQRNCAATGPLTCDRGAQSILRRNVEQVGANPKIRKHAYDPVAAAALLDQRHRALPAPMLAFFCTLLHREAVRQFGILDDRFPSGLGADDEWCYRVRRHGWRNLLVLNSFAAHLHSETFRRLNLNYGQLHREALATLRDVTTRGESKAEL